MLPRRRFLALLGLTPFAPFVGAAAEPVRVGRTARLLTTYVAGMPYHGGLDPAVYATLAPGTRLALHREPTNPHDARALAVHTPDGIRIGYVPRDENTIPSALADQGVPLHAVVTRREDDPDDDPWACLEIAVEQVVGRV